MNRDKYTVLKVMDYLRPHLRPSDLQFVSGFFDRRNKNTISHPGHPTMENWIVGEEDYLWHRRRLQRVTMTVEGIR